MATCASRIIDEGRTRRRASFARTDGGRSCRPGSKDAVCAPGRPQWTSYSLAQGYGGLALLFDHVDRCCPRGGWDAVAHEYLEIAAHGAALQPGVASEHLRGARWCGLRRLVSLSVRYTLPASPRNARSKLDCEGEGNADGPAQSAPGRMVPRLDRLKARAFSWARDVRRAGLAGVCPALLTSRAHENVMAPYGIHRPTMLLAAVVAFGALCVSAAYSLAAPVKPFWVAKGETVAPLQRAAAVMLGAPAGWMVFALLVPVAVYGARVGWVTASESRPKAPTTTPTSAGPADRGRVFFPRATKVLGGCRLQASARPAGAASRRRDL